MRTPSSLLLVFSLGLVTLGCEGSLIGPRDLTGPGGITGPGAVDRPVDPNLPEDAPRELPSPSSRVARLSHGEYENTARDLDRKSVV